MSKHQQIFDPNALWFENGLSSTIIVRSISFDRNKQPPMKSFRKGNCLFWSDGRGNLHGCHVQKSEKRK